MDTTPLIGPLRGPFLCSPCTLLQEPEFCNDTVRFDALHAEVPELHLNRDSRWLLRDLGKVLKKLFRLRFQRPNLLFLRVPGNQRRGLCHGPHGLDRRGVQGRR